MNLMKNPIQFQKGPGHPLSLQEHLYRKVSIIMRTIRFSVISLTYLLIILASTSVDAAELKGKITIRGTAIPSGASIQANCGQWNRSTSISKNGRYSLRGIPSKRSCTFTIRFPGATSAPVSFSTRKSVVTFNAEIQRARNTLLILRR